MIKKILICLGLISPLTGFTSNEEENDTPLVTSVSSLNEINKLLGIGNLTNTLPMAIGTLTFLKKIHLTKIPLTKHIPHEIGQLTNLESLNLSNNKLTGSIPHEIGQLINLESLNLSDNQLTGPVPESMGQLINLVKINLSYNQLTGFFPTFLHKLPKLKKLSLDNNNFEGSLFGFHLPIPEEPRQAQENRFRAEEPGANSGDEYQQIDQNIRTADYLTEEFCKLAFGDPQETEQFRERFDVVKAIFMASMLGLDNLEEHDKP